MTARIGRQAATAAILGLLLAGSILGLGGRAEANEVRSSRSSSQAAGAGCSAPSSAPTACKGVRPGAFINIKGGPGGCTMNFLFEGSDGYRYVGTGGHCVLHEADANGTRIWQPGTGMEAVDVAGRRIGETAFWTLDNATLDFALIRVDPGVKANPAMCQFEGPTKVYRGSDRQPALVHLFSEVSDVGAVLPGRTLVAAFGFPNRHTVDVFGAASPGDSGAPAVLDDGRALGLVSGVGIGWTDPPRFMAGNVFIYRLGPQLRKAERALNIDLRLVSAPDA